MTTTALHHHLLDLMAERSLAVCEGLGDITSYMDHLDDEIATARAAYVGAVVTEIASFRGELYGRQEG